MSISPRSMLRSLRPWVAGIGLAASAWLPAHALLLVNGFQDTFQPSNWTASTAGGGGIDVSGAPGLVQFTSADDEGGPADQTLLIGAPTDAWVEFDWTYDTVDIAATYDALGFLVSGSFHPLSDDLGDFTQSGHGRFRVNQGEQFGFVASSFDASDGAATSGVSNFSYIEIERPPAPVPLPGSAALALLGLAMTGGRRRGGRA